MCLAPSQYTGQYPQQRSSVGRGEYNAAQYAHQHQQHAHQWSSHQRKFWEHYLKVSIDGSIFA